MRLAILSDIHGNLPALEAVMADMAAFSVDQVVVAGDIINWGPFSRQALEIIVQHHWATIRGNNEYYLLDYATPRAPETWRSFTMPPVIHEQLGSHWMKIIAALPDELHLRYREAPPLRVVHGIPNNPWLAVYPFDTDAEICRYLADVAETTIICGHSHIPLDRQVERWHIINPGSVGVPLDGDCSASYMIIENDSDQWQVIAHRRVPFDLAPILAEFERQQFIERCGIEARLVIEEFRTAKIRLVAFNRWLQIHHPTQPHSHALLDQFLQLEEAAIRPYIPETHRHL